MNKKFSISPNIQDYYLLAGRIVPYKRYDIVIKAFNKLGLKLKVVGSGYGLSELKKLATSDKIEFIGRVLDKELTKLLSRCRALIFPALEDFGIIPLEAMAAGRPVVAYGQGGARETIKPGITGEFFQEQTVDSLVQAIKNFKPEKYNPQEIRQHAKQFDKKIFKNKIISFINKHTTNQTQI